MRRTRLALAIVLVLPASIAAADEHGGADAPARDAASEPPWFSRVTVSSPRQLLDDPGIAAARDGTVLASWTWQEGRRVGASAVSRPRGGALGGPRALPAGTMAGPVLYEPRRAVLAAVRPAGSNRDPRSQLRVAFGSASGRFGHARLVARHPRIARPALAGNARGDLALAWFEDRGTRNDRVEVALRRHGRPFGAPLRLATGRVRNVAVAVGAAGHVLVVWAARGVVRARAKRPGDRRFRPVETIRSQPAFFTDLHAGVARSGRAYVAWSAQFRSEGGSVGPGFAELAARAPGHRFGRARVLERFAPEVPQRPVGLAVDAGGGALVGWTSAPEQPRIAEVGADGSFRGLGFDATGVLADVTVSGDRRLALWTHTDAEGARIEALYDAGSGFGPPEIVATGDVRAPHGAMSERSNPVAAYILGNRVQVASRRG